jgi:hypothetical protein
MIEIDDLKRGRAICRSGTDDSHRSDGRRFQSGRMNRILGIKRRPIVRVAARFTVFARHVCRSTNGTTELRVTASDDSRVTIRNAKYRAARQAGNLPGPRSGSRAAS